MAIAAASMGFALFLWWFSTAAILFLDGLARPTFRWTMLAATALAVAAFAAIALTLERQDAAGAFIAFAAALCVWGWNEIAFLTGLVTGPRRTPSPAHAGFWERAAHATAAMIYHELAILAGGLAIFWLTYGAGNQVALWTYLVLAIMRLSAKLNIFLGVPNHAEEFLPEHLAYLRSWFTHKPMNLLFPISVTLSTAALAAIAAAALDPAADAFAVAGLGLVGTLLALAILEHWLLVLPFSTVTLFRLNPTPREGVEERLRHTVETSRVAINNEPRQSAWRKS